MKKKIKIYFINNFKKFFLIIFSKNIHKYKMKNNIKNINYVKISKIFFSKNKKLKILKIMRFLFFHQINRSIF